jgi:hypothetical protein
MQMLRLMNEKSGKLHRWDIGFFCLSPQPVNCKFGDAPKEPWIGSVMFQQMVLAGVISQNGILVADDLPPRFLAEHTLVRSNSLRS